LGFSGVLTISNVGLSEIGLNPEIYKSFYLRAFILSTVGLFFFQFGYYLSSPSSLSFLAYLSNFRWRSTKIRIILILFMFIGFTSFLLLLNNFGGLSSFISNIGSFRTTELTGSGFLIFPATHLLNLGAILYAVHFMNRGKFKYKLRALLFLFLSIVPAFFMGFRGLIILPILEYVVVYNYRVRKISFKRILPISIVVIVLFTSYGVVRELPRGLNTDYESLILLVEENPELVYSVVMRSKGTEVLASVIKKLDETGSYDYGYKSLLEVFTIFIPAKLWNDKPEPSSIRFTTFFFGEDLDYSRGTQQDTWGGVSPTIIGELYWHFGALGVVLGMFLFGKFIKFIYTGFKNNLNNNFVLLIYAEVYPVLLMMAEAIQGYLNGLALYFISWIFVYLILIPVTISRE
jgi:oligosaccharide repeat unit polymerase